MPRGVSKDREWTAEEARESLTTRALAFAERYLGPPHGTKTVVEVGYGKRSAARTAVKLLEDPRVQAILLERRAAGTYSGPIGDEDPSEGEADTMGPASDATSAADYLRWAMNSPSLPVGERTKAAGHLRQIEKEEARIARDSGDHQLVKLRRMVTEILVRKRTRERSGR